MSFSSQTFHTTYWLKQPELQAPLFHRLLGCSAYRQIAREFGVSPSSIAGQAERIGRHCLLFQEQRQPRSLPIEPLVIDGFESFEFSQYHPIHHNLAVGAQSHYLYAHTDAELRRKGRMRPKQSLRRAEIEKAFGRPNPKAIELEVAELVRLAVRRSGPVEIRSDEHQAYPRAFRRVTENQIAHAVTSSKKARTYQNPLFPVNLMDLLIRHCGANHKRETIAWSKRRWSSALRLAVLQVWRNYLKGTSEKQRDSPTPAQLLGLTARRLEVADVLTCRLFPTRVSLPARLLRYYRGEVPTRRFTNNRTHRLSYAD